MTSRRAFLLVAAFLWASVACAVPRAEVYARLEHAQAAVNAGDFVEGRRQFDSLLAIIDHDDHQALAWAYFGRAFAEQQLSETQEFGRERMRAIVEGYRQAWSLDPGTYLAAAHFNAGLILRRLGENRAALAAFIQATTVSHPALGLSYLNAARQYEVLNMPDKAASAYQRAIKEDPDNDEAREALLELYSRQTWDGRLIETAQAWSATYRSLPFINYKLNELLQRTAPKARNGIADAALLLLAHNHARMGLTSANFVRSAKISYERAAAVHPRLRMPIRALVSAYQMRPPGNPYVETRDSAWWRDTYQRHAVWSSVLKSVGDQYWLGREFMIAASYYDAAVGYRVPYRIETWVNLDALVMLTASLIQGTGDIGRIAELVLAVDSWRAQGNPKTSEQGNALRDFYFTAGWAYTQSLGYDRAIELYKKSLELDPEYAVSYVNLGYIYMGSLKLAEAIRNFERAVALDPTDSMANNNLGFVTLIHADFDKAIHYLDRAHQKQDFLLNTINLGDAYRYAGDADRALELHLAASRGIRTRSADEDYMGTGWRYNYMPLRRGDTRTIRESILVRSPSEKRAFVQYALSFDYALVGDIVAAQREFAAATRHAYSRDIRCFFANKIAAIQVFVRVTGPPARWLDEKRLELRSGLDCTGS